MNEDGVRPARFLASGARSRPVPAGAAVAEIAFCLPDLPDVRDFATVQAMRSGMSQESLADFLVAVNEVATNAVTHGHATAKAVLRMWTVGRTLVVEIHDEGQWSPDGPPGDTPPAPYATSGMGLWVARMISSDIKFETGAAGTFITMSFKV
ncbi:MULTISPECIES: ATP-binding protein [Streptosporangium]|uniref:Anti-sigma regulatory factor (Ser/Thr protein kinase) n=1 Tax=Streptosporangium brasiliense TaxID=47480 RepID=A0ABT9QYK3_9ACTN|nr:ATP-binding protein [Streptosporangium brasiliense]MDP9862061.1 anti-sigma regulatory factor (Ser/Thr protein kinase) [Streptosporangium brasiliense]